MRKTKAADTEPNLHVDYNLLEKLDLIECRAAEPDLINDLKILTQHLENKDFGVGEATMGSELELFLVDKNSLSPSMINTTICEHYKNKNIGQQIQTEISRFCLEYNGPVIATNKQPLTTLINEMELILHDIRAVAKKDYNSLIIPIGIIPTLTLGDLANDALTPYWRYYAIDKTMSLLRNKQQYKIHIHGENPLQINWPNTVIEGVNSSYQVHLRVNPSEYNNMFNAAQLAAAFVLSVSGNSPLLLGHKLWEETRIAVFEQIVNNLSIHPGQWQEQQRVAFGRGWIKDGVFGLLKETCELFYPVLPTNCRSSTHNTTSKRGPELTSLIKHNSSVWPWNRAIYDPSYGGHFRIEMRYLPAGPTVADMAMNAGFMLGLTKYFSNNIHNIICDLPFKYAQYNFYQAAQYGLKATCVWAEKNKITEQPIINLLDQMLDSAAFGLYQLGVSDKEINNMQVCIRNRYKNRQTGAVWQRIIFDNLINNYKLNTQEALYNMFKLYIKNQGSDKPIGEWSLSV